MKTKKNRKMLLKFNNKSRKKTYKKGGNNEDNIIEDNSNSYEFIIRRHANSCDNIFKFLGLLFLKERLTTKTEPNLSLWGIYATILLDTILNKNEENIFYPNLIFVSSLIRTWMTATLLYLPYIQDNTLILYVAPYLKEHGSDYSNMPNPFDENNENDSFGPGHSQKELYEEFLLYILFLRKLLRENIDNPKFFTGSLKTRLQQIMEILNQIKDNTIIKIMKFDGNYFEVSIQNLLEKLENENNLNQNTINAALKYSKLTIPQIQVPNLENMNKIFIDDEIEIEPNYNKYEENPIDNNDPNKLLIENFVSWVFHFLNDPNNIELKNMLQNKIYVIAHANIMRYFIKSNNILSSQKNNEDTLKSYKEITKTNTWTIDFIANNNIDEKIMISNIKILEGMKQPQNKDIELECEQDCFVREQNNSNAVRIRFKNRLEDDLGTLDKKCITKLDKKNNKTSADIDDAFYKFSVVKCGTKNKLSVSFDECLGIERMMKQYNNSIKCNLYRNNDGTFRVRRMLSNGSYDLEEDKINLDNALNKIIEWLRNESKSISYNEIIPLIERLKMEIYTYLSENPNLFRRIREGIEKDIYSEKRISGRQSNIVYDYDIPIATGGNKLNKYTRKITKNNKHNKTNKYSSNCNRIYDVKYIKKFFSQNEFDKLKSECKKLDNLLVNEQNSVSPNRENVVIKSTHYIHNLVYSKKILDKFKNIIGFEIKPSKTIPVEYRRYRIGAKMNWHRDVILNKKCPQIETVFTIENESDSSTQWIDDSTKKLHSIQSIPNSCMILQGGGPKHRVTRINSGYRTIVKVAYDVVL